jgi:hypothetical protein
MLDAAMEISPPGSWILPLGAGGAASWTTFVHAETTEVEPMSFLAVTRERSVLSTSLVRTV